LRVKGKQFNLQEVFEAEYAWINNFNLTQNGAIVAGQGNVVMDTICSGGAKVSSLGNNPENYIEFRTIFANSSGRYRLTISYLNNENDNAVISINGKDTVLTNLNSGSLSTVANCTIPVKLNMGYNTIRIGNATSKLPDIDKIQLDLNTEAKSGNTSKFIRKIKQLFKPK